MKKIFKIFCIIIIFIILILFAAFDNRLKIVNYKMKSDDINGTVKIALIADLHNCLYGENQLELIDAIDLHNPDAVLLAGDIFDDLYKNDNARILIEGVVKKYKTYFVSGNHDWWSDEMKEHFRFLEKSGVTVLRGDSDYLTIDDNTIIISGVDDYAVNTYEPLYKSYEKQLIEAGACVSDDKFNILLAHRPELADQYFEYDFDLVLSGHTHGGQGRIPFFLNGFFAPDQGYFPKLVGGMYKFGENKMIISRGLSRENTTLPRIFNRPELVFVSVKEKNAPPISLGDFPKLSEFIWQLKVKLHAIGE